MLPKIIVTTGCSYGIFFDSFKSFGNVDGLEMILDLHSISLGSTFQAISIIETVDNLIKNGVKSEDIFVLAEFSQITRRDIIIANDLFVDILENLKTYDEMGRLKSKSPYPIANVLKNHALNNDILSKITQNKFHPSNFPKFGNYYVTNPESDVKNFPNEILKDVFSYYVKELKVYNRSVDICNIESVSRALTFFQNILLVQNFLKERNIRYKFCLMQNQFSMWSKSGHQMDLVTKEMDGEHYLVQNYKDSTHVWDINNMIKIISEMVDWNGWWFYENLEKNIVWGGIDEFAIDVFGKKAYPKTNGNKNLFHQHPDVFVYDILIKEHLMKEYFK